MPDLLSPAAVADMHACSPRAVQDAIKSGRLAAVRVLGPSGSTVALGVKRRDAERFAPRSPGRPPTEEGER